MKYVSCLLILLIGLATLACYHTEPGRLRDPPAHSIITVSIPVTNTLAIGSQTNWTFVVDEGPIINPPTDSRIQSMTLTDRESIDINLLKTCINQPDLLKKDVYAYPYSQTFTYNQQGKAIWPNTLYLENKLVVKSALNYGPRYPLDTFYIDQAGYVTKQTIFHFGVKYSKDFIYNSDYQLLKETYFTLNACGLPTNLLSIDQEHTVVGGNRVASDIIESTTTKQKRSIQYDFDMRLFNTRVGHDLVHIASFCGGEFMRYGDPRDEIFGKVNKNLIRQTTVTDEAGKTKIFNYIYTFDDKGRVIRVLIVSFPKLIAENPYQRYGIDMREYKYED